MQVQKLLCTFAKNYFSDLWLYGDLNNASKVLNESVWEAFSPLLVTSVGLRHVFAFIAYTHKTKVRTFNLLKVYTLKFAFQKCVTSACFPPTGCHYLKGEILAYD